MWEPITDTVIKTIGAFRPSVEARAEEWLGQKLPDHLDDRCWQLIGYDIALDADLNPIFFEANAQTRQTISMMVKQPDGSFVPGVSEFFPEVFPPMLKEKYKIMLGSEDTGRWTKVYDSNDTQGHLHERSFRVFKNLFPEDQHMTRLTEE